jgi:hypothetical protein
MLNVGWRQSSLGDEKRSVDEHDDDDDDDA